MTDFEQVYKSLQSLELGIQALAEVAEDWCEEDAKYALVRLLSDNLSRQLGGHQQTVYGYLASLRQGKVQPLVLATPTAAASAEH